MRPTVITAIAIVLSVVLPENILAATLPPTAPQRLSGLKTALNRYETIRRAGGWPSLPPGPTLRPGDTGPRVARLIHRLAASGDLKITTPVVDPDDRYTPVIETAVRRFQRRHGLAADGMVGQRTLAELNIPVAHRIRQLQVNMERHRWYPDGFGDRYLLVNIPAFELCVIEDGATALHMRVIVGSRHRQTPVMSSRMTYLEFNPYWNIPRRIARRDILPKVMADPAYLAHQGIRIFDGWDHAARELDPQSVDWGTVSPDRFPYRLRQDPSAFNALGRVKFMFPNHHSVYIHDTPTKSLFAREQRHLSSGCVRVESPILLAGHLLQAQGWKPDRIEAAVDRENRQTVVLEHPIPVHLVYFTAWVDDDGQLNFREDIYGRDRRLLAALLETDGPSMQCGPQSPATQPLATGGIPTKADMASTTTVWDRLDTAPAGASNISTSALPRTGL